MCGTFKSYFGIWWKSDFSKENYYDMYNFHTVIHMPSAPTDCDLF